MLDRGTRIAHYEIAEPIGRGGMGEVYRAHDTKLERDVAIKVLPDVVASDGDLVVRLEREAKVLASLNHPNIAAIYGVETAGDAHALVLELVDGPTLAERIAEGPIPVDKAVAISLQIIAALEAAHSRGVVHRDLKPANVKLTPDGSVKVLDFGLAKAFAATEPNVDSSDSPTLTKGTAHGVILGTAAYMSPEQARGKPVDKRADIWAFGVVLYEMLTGRKLFAGETVSDVLAAVLTREPQLPAVPAHVATVLRRCLRKDSSQRLHDIADARLELTDPHPPSTEAPRRGALGWFAAAAIASVLVFVLVSRPDPVGPVMRVDIATPPTTDLVSFAIAPDGETIAFVGVNDGVEQLWVRSLRSSEVRPLRGTEGASYPFWSPDSRQIGFFADRSLKRIDLDTEQTRALAPARAGRGGAWAPSGEIVYAPASLGPLLVTYADGRDPTPVTTLGEALVHRFPHFLPNGRHFLFHAPGDESGVFVGSLDDPEVRRVVAADTNAVYTAGRILFARQGSLWAQPFDLDRLRAHGPPMLVADNVTRDLDRNVVAASASPDGKILLRTGATETRRFAWFSRSGAELGAIGAPDTASPWDVQLSADDRRVATRRTVDDANPDIWIVDVERGVHSRLTHDAAVDVWPVFSPDGRWVAFGSTRRGVHDLFRKPASGTGSAESIFESPRPNVPTDWSPDGRLLVFHHRTEATSVGMPDVDLWALPMDDGGEPFSIAATPFRERHGQVSPDGKWLAYTSNQSGRDEVYVQAFPEADGQWQVSNDGGAYPRWRPDVEALYFLHPSGDLMSVGVTARGDDIDFTVPTALFRVNIVGGRTGSDQSHQYDVASDGERFLINTVVPNGNAPMTLLLNWRPSTTP